AASLSTGNLGGGSRCAPILGHLHYSVDFLGCEHYEEHSRLICATFNGRWSPVRRFQCAYPRHPVAASAFRDSPATPSDVAPRPPTWTAEWARHRAGR